jgi:hypothetical protein
MSRRRPQRPDIEEAFELLIKLAAVRGEVEVVDFIKRCLARDDQHGLLTCVFAINNALRILREAERRRSVALHVTPPIGGPQGTPS